MAPRPTALIIFTTSERPDPYINCIGYAFENYNLTDVTFVSIVEDGYESEASASVSKLAAAISDKLDQLSAGTYLGTGQAVPISATASRRYTALRTKYEQAKISYVSVDWRQLPERLRELSKNSATIFDVTALRKPLLVDAVALLIADEKSDVFSFDLLRSPHYNDEDLIHALEPHEYEYRCLTDSIHVRAARRKLRARTVSFRALAIITAAIFVIVLIIDLMFEDSFVATVVLGLATAASIGSWLYPFRRAD